jgi:hypothetical protein
VTEDFFLMFIAFGSLFLYAVIIWGISTKPKSGEGLEKKDGE